MDLLTYRLIDLRDLSDGVLEWVVTMDDQEIADTEIVGIVLEDKSRLYTSPTVLGMEHGFVPRKINLKNIIELLHADESYSVCGAFHVGDAFDKNRRTIFRTHRAHAATT